MNNKQVVQDILPPNERSIRKIPIPPKRIPIRKIEKVEIEPEEVEDLPFQPITKKRRKIRPLFWVIGFILLLFVIWSFTVNSALIQITLKEASHDVNETLTADKTSDLSSKNIPFQIITVSKELSKQLVASGEKQVERKAVGEITIFNKYSERPQPLITNTRFETPEGLIYRINESVTVPGFTKNGSEIIPGQLKVKIYADFPGDEYNIGLTDFTIPGFKGSPQFNTIFARSSSTIDGGLVGKVKIVDDKTLENTIDELKNNLTLDIKNSALAEVPSDFILIPQSLKTTFETPPQKNVGDSVEIIEKITASGIILSRRLLEKSIVSEVLKNPEEDITISNLETLNFDLGKNSNLENVNSFEFTISGNAKIIWNLDEEALKTEIVGQPKKELQKILSKYVAIEKAISSIKPFWKRSFPKDPEKIKIEHI